MNTNEYNQKSMFCVVCMYSFGTILLLAKHLTTYWCVQAALIVWSKMHLPSCFATEQQLQFSLQECNIKIVQTHITYIMCSWESIFKKLSFMQDKTVSMWKENLEKKLFSIV